MHRLGDCIGIVVQGNLAEEDDLAHVTCEQGLVAGNQQGPVLSVARRCSTLELPIVIEGETATGKELFARAIHAWS